MTVAAVRPSIRVVAGALGATLAVVAVASLAVGAVRVTPAEMAAALRGLVDGNPAIDGRAAVLLGLRLPRVVLGVVVGAGLGASGAAMQGLVRNPLADPGLLGVSSGAAVGAVVFLVVGAPVAAVVPAVLALPAAAFAGALGASVLAWKLASLSQGSRTTALLLVGIAINALAGACIGLAVFVADDPALRSIAFWNLGSLGGASWTTVLSVLPWIVLALTLLPRIARSLDAMLLGEAEAGSLGVDVESVRRAVIAWVAIAVGASVAVAGTIGFIGLLAPHLVRLVAGPGHRVLFVGSALLGACLLVGADAVSRTLVAPSELPVGIVTAFAGSPVLLVVLMRRHEAT